MGPVKNTPVRSMIHGNECEITTPIIQSNTPRETQLQHRTAIIRAVRLVIPEISERDVEQINQIWDRQLSDGTDTRTLRYGATMIKMTDEKNCSRISPNFFIERKHKPYEIISDILNFKIDQLTFRFRRS